MELTAIVKRDCETCQMVVPVLSELLQKHQLIVYSQDDPTFPDTLGGARDDTALEHSYRHRIEAVPTLIRSNDGVEVGRAIGWNKAEWQELTELRELGSNLPSSRPGCGSRTLDPGMAERLALRYGGLTLKAREIQVPPDVDPIEVMYDRGWSDGLPAVPPTDLRIAHMLSATSRRPDEIIGTVPPNLMKCTIEKVAINAVMAGCRPEYFPVVLAAVEGALKPEFSMHGLLATLWFSGPVLIVNGPVTKRIGMNAAGNALGQGNRANSTIGRALQLVIRNVGGGIPGEIDRSVLGNPGKVGFCFPEDESDPDWTPLNVARGAAPGTNSVTLFHGDGVQGVNAGLSTNPESLTNALAMALFSVTHPKYSEWGNAILALGPDHYAVFSNAGLGRRADIEGMLWEALKRPGRDLIRGAQGTEEGIDPARADEIVNKFHDGGLLVVRAGGKGGGMTGIIGGWTAQRNPKQVQIVSQEIKP
ncbi:MAG: thioredoxin family protein [Hyphomicrobiaceae bacterium]